MHNWWIAAMEHAGIWTREEAQHVSDNIKNSIHKENYRECFNELGRILEKGNFNKIPLVTRLETDVAALKQPPKVAPVAQKPKS